jgi:hypothetical protein
MQNSRDEWYDDVSEMTSQDQDQDDEEGHVEVEQEVGLSNSAVGELKKLN